MSLPDVIVIGDINVDIVAPIDHYSLAGGHGVTHGVRIKSGGSATNTAVMLDLLGLLVLH